MPNVLGTEGAQSAFTGAVAQAARLGTSQPPGQRWRAFALLVVAYFITIVDFTIVNVALPTIGRDLRFPEADLQWVVTAYGLTFAGFLLLGGRTADLLGRRRVLMAGLVVFTCASLGGGLASTDTFLIAMRGLQGLGAALVLPAALSIVVNMFSEGAERNKALGSWGRAGALGGTVGLLAGGILTGYAGWQYIFFFNVPIGVAVASSVAASHFRTLIHHGDATAAALAGGFHLALWVCGLTGLAAVPVAAGLFRPHRDSHGHRDLPNGPGCHCPEPLAFTGPRR